ncbi:MAG: hypothetical protein M1817_001620 [Caeruleum heppii]|nr:MAG: hypothetical protein M1817_001620 [Caeruleum heppii]
MAQPSHDVSMQTNSSTPDVDSEEVMFPTTIPSPTLTTDNPPTNLQRLQAGDLSPPDSQHAVNDTQDAHDPMDYVPVSPQQQQHGQAKDAHTPSPWPDAVAGILKASKKQTTSGDRPDGHVPGSAWNNKRAMEECARAAEGLVDTSWSIKDLGDPFDESDMKSSDQ